VSRTTIVAAMLACLLTPITGPTAARGASPGDGTPSPGPSGSAAVATRASTAPAGTSGSGPRAGDGREPRVPVANPACECWSKFPAGSWVWTRSSDGGEEFKRLALVTPDEVRIEVIAWGGRAGVRRAEEVVPARLWRYPENSAPPAPAAGGPAVEVTVAGRKVACVTTSGGGSGRYYSWQWTRWQSRDVPGAFVRFRSETETGSPGGTKGVELRDTAVHDFYVPAAPEGKPVAPAPGRTD
jgi:hypothetical protein